MTQFLNTNAVAERYGISKCTVRKLAREGALPMGIKIGGSRLWELTELEMFEALKRQEAAL